MRLRKLEVLVVLVLAGTPGLGAAIDWQHEKPGTNMVCSYCHTLQVKSPGGALDYTPACLGCHNIGSNRAFGFPWQPEDEAVPGVTGHSHSWSGMAESPEHGAKANLSVSEAYLLVDGALQCAVCHNAHRTEVAVKGSSMHASIPAGEWKDMTGGTGTGQLRLTVVDGSSPAGYRVKVTEVSGGGGKFIISHVQGAPANSWLNWTGSAWVAGTEGGAGRSFTNDVDVDLDVPGVKVRWSAGAAVGDYWDFYVGYPFLRFSNVGDANCVKCHKEREMNHVRARGDDRYYRPNGVRKFSHPVNVGLNANGFGQDRAAVLDADGTVGSSTTDGAGGVANASNDLTLDGGVVRCTTCHAAHNADSNSLSVDER